MILQTSGKVTAMPLGFGAVIPSEFRSLEEARNSLDYQTNGLSKFFKDAEDQIAAGVSAETDLESSRDYWSNQIANWVTAFEVFMKRSAAMLDDKSQQAAWALKIHQRVGSLHLKPRTSTMLADQTTWDVYMQECEDIVKFAEHIVALDEIKRGHLAETKIEFSLDMQLVGPVYVVAHKCRDPTLRRRAIALLKKAQRQEGLWDSTIAARVAERIVAIEEGAVGRVIRCQDIPLWARVDGVDVGFDKQERRGHFSYRRARSQEQPAIETYEEMIYW